ncbi:L,D-transpeptidase family protein [Kozakia baliensis]|uniref:L,D-transpeptidase family protein n=1 Tax=Kozakia baliensis TaxID=153496 RepID=UPI00345C59D1
MKTAILQARGDGNGLLSFQREQFVVSIGAGGIRADKQEGDHATPVGLLPLRHVLYRADRVLKPRTALPCAPIAPNDGWCDDPTYADYNKAVTLPYPGRHESLWRDDHSYDLIAVLGWNDSPPERGRGSAIFLHLPTQSGVTEGCIALPEPQWRHLLAEGLTAIDIQGA